MNTITFNLTENVKDGCISVSLFDDGRLLRSCIGSGPNARDAKAAAIRNLRELIEKVQALPDEMPPSAQ